MRRCCSLTAAMPAAIAAAEAAYAAESDGRRRVYALLVEALAAEESGDKEAAVALYPRIVAADPARGSEEAVRAQVLEGVIKLQRLRQENGLSPLCPSAPRRLEPQTSRVVLLHAAVNTSGVTPELERGGLTTSRQGRAMAALRLLRAVLVNLLLVNGYASAPEIESAWHESCDTRNTHCAGDVGVLSP